MVRRRHPPETAQRLIVEAAIAFLWERSFREMTVDRLMAQTPLSRPAFYQYFDDLYELMEALLARVQAEISAAANPWLSGEKPALPALRASVEGLVSVSLREGPIMRAVAEAAPQDLRLEALWSKFVKDFEKLTRDRIKMDQRDGTAAKVNAEATARALTLFDAAYIIDQFGRRPLGNPKIATETIFRMFSAAIYSPEIGRTGRAKTRKSKAMKTRPGYGRPARNASPR